jgi:hypothetical protein
LIILQDLKLSFYPFGKGYLDLIVLRIVNRVTIGLLIPEDMKDLATSGGGAFEF